MLEKPVSVTGVDLKSVTEDFVKNLGCGYWAYQASLMDSVQMEMMSYPHATFMRMSVAHADEHLFGLIFAALQAPRCPNL